MKVCVCSALRNSAHYIQRYFYQISDLRKALRARGDLLTLVIGEGDSVDGTRKRLIQLSGSLPTKLVWVDHGGPDYGSIVDPERFKQLAYVWSAIWPFIPADADAVLYLESDLVWEVETMIALLDDLRVCTAAAPMVMLERAGYPDPFFYDVFAFRKDGQPFNQQQPYFAGWPPEATLVHIDSAGSCVAITGWLARSLHWRVEDLIVGLCTQMRDHGHGVWLDSTLTVKHY